MKNLIISLAAASVLFVIGCQENSIIDPIANESSNKVQAETPDTYLRGTILLEGVLRDPYPVGNSFYRINGEIEFEQRFVNAEPITQLSKRYAALYFTTNAHLSYFCTVCSPPEDDVLAGIISEVSEDYVPLGGNYVSLLEKTFKIQGRTDSMVLKVRFLVSNSGVEMSSMWLALPHVITQSPENVSY
jgi:hypothetical protein